MDSLQRATIQHRARAAADALQLLNGLLRDVLDLGEFPFVRLYEAESVARKIEQGEF